MSDVLEFSGVDWQTKALDAFALSIKDGLHPDDVGGKHCQRFGDGLKSVNTALLPPKQISRGEIFALAADRSVNTATVCAAALAWGGMNERFTKPFFAMATDGWLSVADRIRGGSLDRKAAYSALSTLRQEGKLHGTGPAYFTKLIYFLAPRSEGQSAHPYIMDQWAGCSLNLLVGRELVRMNVTRRWTAGKQDPEYSYQVSEANACDDYEAFCAHADVLRSHFGLSPDQVDRFMVAQGGRNKSSWRKYVIENRRV